METDLPAALAVAGEERYTTIILQNLLENARKYTAPAGRIRVAAREDRDGSVLVTVGNAGAGIPPAARERIFERFHRGVSASRGPCFRPGAGPTLPRGRGIGDHEQYVLGQDVCYARRHLQPWAEFYEARFEVPRVGNADTFAYCLGARYKFTPQISGALRWNQQLFGDVRNGEGGRVPWGRDLWRTDAAGTYRFTENLRLKLQSSLEHERSGPQDLRHTLAGQFTVRC